MRPYRWILAVLVLLLVASFSSLAFAQESELKEIAAGLNSPRQLTFGADGTLYIAEAGMGGDQDGAGPFGPAKWGPTGQISAVSPEGEQSVAIGELISMDVGFGQIEGPMAVHVTDSSFWVVQGMGPKALGEGQYVASLIEFARQDLTVNQAVDLGAWETGNNPDKAEEIVSNPADIAVADDGTVYIADASGNSLLSWTPSDGIRLFAAWAGTEGNPQAVPTSVAIGPDGDIYVGFLSGFPFPAGGARIERYSADGKLKETFDGLTLVTDVLITEDGTIYAVQFSSGFGDAGYLPDSGSVVTVTSSGLTPVAEGLNFPYGIARSPDGAFVVSVDSFGAAPEGGRVVMLAGA